MTEAPSQVDPGRNCWRIERATRATVIVDAADYFTQVREAMLKAEHRILLIGWDFDPRIRLDRTPDDPQGVPANLGDFVRWLADNRPGLQINILKWDLGALKLLARGRALVAALRWALHDRITFKLDGAHPVGASHHQKVVVIDDAFAVCGGIDMTSDRWDTREHLDKSPQRLRPDDEPYGPWHDITMMVDGPVSRALGELGRDRWTAAGGEDLPMCPPGSDPWPEKLEPTFRDVDIGIARTRAAYGDGADVREIEALYVDLIGSARHFIYAENQYFASRKIAEAIAKRLAEPDPPEIVLVMPVTADGWLEQVAMDGARDRLMQSLNQVGAGERFRIYHPVTSAGEPIYVHAKLMIVDDQILRIGSSNMNNRSLSLDSECDLVIDSGVNAACDIVPALNSLRISLLAEHLDADPVALHAELKRSGSMIVTIEQRRGNGRTLVPFTPGDLGEVATLLADNEVLDPEIEGGNAEPMTRRSLFRRRSILPEPDASPTAD